MKTIIMFISILSTTAIVLLEKRNYHKNVKIDSLTHHIDSLQDEVSYLRGLEKICFPVATK